MSSIKDESPEAIARTVALQAAQSLGDLNTDPAFTQAQAAVASANAVVWAADELQRIRSTLGEIYNFLLTPQK